jgi:CheY-specific phosphatase CheX
MSSPDNHRPGSHGPHSLDTGTDDPGDHDMARWLDQLDATISEVFEQMLGVTCLPSATASQEEEQFKVVLHVTGEIERTFCLYFDKAAAKAAVYAFTQDDTADWEPQVEDAVGEIGNMVVGTLKRKLLTSAIPSSLSIPTVSREYRETPSPVRPGSSGREYEFLDNTLEIRLNFGPSAPAEKK